MARRTPTALTTPCCQRWSTERRGRRYLTNLCGEYEILIAAQGTFAGDQIRPIAASSWQESVPAPGLTVERLHRRFESARVQRAIMGLLP
jgi:hypothetical protein